jgi:hypothetical protein
VAGVEVGSVIGAFRGERDGSLPRILASGRVGL